MPGCGASKRSEFLYDPVDKRRDGSTAKDRRTAGYIYRFVERILCYDWNRTEEESAVPAESDAAVVPQTYDGDAVGENTFFTLQQVFLHLEYWTIFSNV